LLALIGPFIINAPMYYTHGTTYQSFQQYFALICSFGLGVSIFQMFVAVENAKQLTAMRALRNCIQLRFVEVQTEP